jgi:hypothetical protein
MILRYIIWIFVIYGLYRLIFDVIIPVARVSGEMKKKDAGVPGYRATTTTPSTGSLPAIERY